MPDDWEIQNGFDPLNANDAAQDADHDGTTNLQEYVAGTNPNAPIPLVMPIILELILDG